MASCALCFLVALRSLGCTKGPKSQGWQHLLATYYAASRCQPLRKSLKVFKKGESVSLKSSGGMPSHENTHTHTNTHTDGLERRLSGPSPGCLLALESVPQAFPKITAPRTGNKSCFMYDFSLHSSH